MSYLTPATDSWTLALSAAIGCLTAFLVLDLAVRVRTSERGIGYLWWGGGSLVGGTGLWAMNFLGMQARTLPIPIGYAGLMTTVSWICSVGAVGLALTTMQRRKRPGRVRLIGSAALFGVIFCLAEITGLAAVELSPGIAWDVPLALVAAACAFVVSAALLFGVERLRDVTGWRAPVGQAVIAFALGVGFAAADVTMLAAARVPLGAVCFSALSLDGTHLGDIATITVPLLLTCVLLGSLVYGWVDQRRRQLAGSLEHVAARLVSANDELRQRAMLDPLTGLPNRVLFEDRLAQALLRTDRAKKSVRGLREKLAVLFIDIDGFKPVNDSFGHAAGDEMIRQVAQRLRVAARDEDTVSRVGSDQFLVLLEGASSNDGVALASRIIDAVKAPFRIDERCIQISVSIGIVIYPDHGERNKLLAQADAAMQAAKRAGRGSYALFESHMHQDIADQLELVNGLRQAIELNQFELYYQPKVDGRRHVICGVEALLRWHHPVRGPVSPAVFIPIAERFGYINVVGAWVIEEACRQMAAWAAQGVKMRVAINLSVHQLREPDLVARIGSALARHGVNSSHLLCEITESVAMQDIAATQRALDGLGKIGVYLSIDDFGTGYSSLSYLRQLPARQLKIDRTFINDLDTSDDAKAVVDGVVRLAHALGLRVVAEGVETATQRDILLALNCDELQGYFFAHPMSADKLLAWTHGRKPKGTVEFAQSLMHQSHSG